MGGYEVLRQPSTIATLVDDDNDTKIQVEESADEDIIRFDTAGNERMTIDSAGAILIKDDLDLTLGNDSDWKIQYDEGVDNQLLIATTNTSATATTDPMVLITVGTTPTADQIVFGVAKGTQSSSTQLLTVDEDGDCVVRGDLRVRGNDIKGEATLNLFANTTDGNSVNFHDIVSALSTEFNFGANDDLYLSQGTSGSVFMRYGSAGTAYTFGSSLATFDKPLTVAATQTLTIPQGANPTIDAAGELAVDTTIGCLKYYDGAERVLSPLHTFSITIENPVSGEDISITRFEHAITITEIEAVVIGSSTPSVTIEPVFSDDRNAVGTDLLTSPTAITNTTTGQNLTSFNDATIPADNYIWLETDAQSGTVTELHLTFHYRIDP